MSSTPRVRHLFIDFENVPDTTLDSIRGQEVEVTLLVGEKNKRLDMDLVDNLLAGGSRTHLVRVGASGRNALDLTLAYYVGRAAVTTPGAALYVISKDTDYDAMIAHARRTGVEVARFPSVDGLPFLARHETRAPEPKPVPSRLPEGLADFVENLRLHPKNRPARQSTLLRHLKSWHGGHLTEPEATGQISALVAAGFISISEKGTVTYRL